MKRRLSSDASRRQALKSLGSLVLLLGVPQIARGATIVAVRMWPADEYTRVTIESDQALRWPSALQATPS